MSKKPVLLFPIEVKAREFPARIFLAGIAVQMGYQVIIGRSKILHRNLYKFPRGIIFENDATYRSLAFFTKARQQGFKIVAWDEESLVTLTDSIYAELRVSSDVVSLTEKFFCRGLDDLQALHDAYPQIIGKLIAAGNPRLDILNPEWTGDIPDNSDRPVTLLINSRFSIVNPFYISPEKAKNNVFKKFGVSKESEIGQHVNGWLNHASEMFIAFSSLVENIAQKYPEYKIIIRPHPSENHNFWKDIADKYSNCECLYEGSAADWFLKADCLIHNSCTTAIEASLSGLPCYSYLPAGDNIYDAELPNSVSKRYNSSADLIDSLKEIPKINEALRQEISCSARRDLAPAIENVESMGCSRLILKHAEDIHLDSFTVSMAVRKFYDAFRMNLSQLKHGILDSLKGNQELLDARKGYAKQKYNGMSTEEITMLLKQYNFNGFTVSAWKNEWFRISQSEE